MKKRLLLALPFIAGASWAGTTYISSINTQDAYQQLLTQLSALQPLNFENESYQEGFLYSSAITVVKGHAFDGTEVLFRLKHDIDHSSVALDETGTHVGSTRITTSLIQEDLPDEAQQFIQQHMTNAAPFTLHTEVGFNGNIVNHFELNGLTAENDNSHFQFDGGTLTVESDSSGHHVASGNLSQITYSEQGKLLTIDPASLDFDLQTIDKNVYTGEMTYLMPAISIEKEGQSPVRLENFTLQSETQLNSDNIYSAVSFNIATIQSSIPIDSFQMSMAIDGLKLENLTEYNKQLEAFEAEDLANATPQELMNLSATINQKIYTPGVNVDFSVSANNKGGSVSNRFGLQVVGDGSESGYEFVETVGDLINVFEMENHLHMDQDSISGSPIEAYLQSPQAQMMIMNNGQSYTSDIYLADSLVTINGEQVPLSNFLGSLLDKPVSTLLQ